MLQLSKALIVDDSRDVQLIVSAVLRSCGYEVVRASDGEEAWAILQTQAIRLVITDWMMPRLNGIELSRRIRAAGFSHYTYIILLTARDEKEDFVAGMASGADDFLTKPLVLEDLRIRLRVAERILALQSQLEERNRGLEEANARLGEAYARIRDDLEAAARMQRSLLPRTSSTLSGIGFDWLFLPSSFVAGDIFNFYQIDESHVAFYLLDVAGHGVKSAMLSVTLCKLLTPLPTSDGVGRSSLPLDSSRHTFAPECVIADLNQRFTYDPSSMLYFTMIYGLIDTRTRRLTLCQAGHPAPLYLPSGGAPSFVGSGGFPVGLLASSEYERLELDLSPGDRLVLYSDGITDCADQAGALFSDTRLAEVLTEHRDLPLRDCLQILEARLRAWNGARDFEDDISLLALEVR